MYEAKGERAISVGAVCVRIENGVLVEMPAA